MEFAKFNERISRYHSRQYARNAAENYQRIKAEFRKADYSIDSLPRYDPAAHIPALILGSGPTLDDSLPFIKDFNGLVFGSPSQLDLLEYWDIAPDYIVSVDSADNVGEEQIRNDRDCHGMILLTHPAISPKTLDAWTGCKRYFEPKDETNTIHFRDVYPWIKTSFPVCGNVNNAQVLIANWMGCNPIILSGVDCGFPGGRTRAQDYRKRGPFIFDPKPLQYCDTRDGKLSVSPETLFYKNLLLGLWKMYLLPLVQVGDKGACSEIPFIQPKDIASCRMVDIPTLDKIREIDLSMLEHGMFASVREGSLGSFHWKEHDMEAVGLAKTAYESASDQADWWTAPYPTGGGIKDES